MSLFTSSAELRPYIPVDASFGFELIQTHLEAAAEQKLLPYVGQAEYDRLMAGTYTELHKPLVNQAKRIVANYGYLLYSPFAPVRIDEGGVSEKEGSARVSTLDGIRQACLDAGHRGIEALLRYLASNANQTTFTDWKASSAYTTFTDFFIQDAAELQTYVNIRGSYRVFLALRPAMRRVSDLYLKPALTPGLYAALKEDPTTTAHKTLLDEYVRPALAHLALGHGLSEMATILGSYDTALIFDNTASGPSSQYRAVEADRLREWKTELLATADVYLDTLREYLVKNITSYPAYAAASAIPVQATLTNAADAAIVGLM